MRIVSIVSNTNNTIAETNFHVNILIILTNISLFVNFLASGKVVKIKILQIFFLVNYYLYVYEQVV